VFLLLCFLYYTIFSFIIILFNYYYVLVAEVAESRRPIKDKHQFLRWKMNLINAFSSLTRSNSYFMVD